MKVTIAIDGPAASGKSSVAREVARRLNFGYVNSGAFYRAVTWRVLEDGSDPLSTKDVTRTLAGVRITAPWIDNEATVHLDDKDPEPFLRESRVNDNVSAVSRVPAVRETLLPIFHRLAGERDVVMEGRDIGSVVFPDSPYKFYLDASPDVRRQRRTSQGENDEIAARDRSDSNRVSAPLVIAEDALVVDSTNLTIDGVVGEVIGRLKLLGLQIPRP